ncbi:MAG: hypothetical protein GTN89_16060, partial [Acidobacteria bacterium]|nr:hypothetical protein [Acidobacteriota bacterium]NIM62612.1 hypothetical protein [Acidobacteriota bacterium]NIO60745.1 hypothetical protein [Acidobacteriota bacterium]NIQ31817.1 hypothetical protein [Acidobacteriota bacterium]NIQ87145.1 hypothetical protein [Acidobacteriota bacterium]
MLRPDEFPEDSDFDVRLADRTPLPPCTSATRRDEIGGLPPREGVCVPLEAGPAWSAQARMERAVRSGRAGNALERKNMLRRIRHALASGAALEKICAANDEELLAPARAAQRSDPRLDWLVEMAPRWRTNGDKTLV